jgi:hypothetical protein
MGTIIQFPDDFFRYSRDVRPASGEDATVIILPTVRVERHEDPTNDGSDSDSNSGKPSRSRRRRGSR